jgi:hypothetical protein
MAIIINSNINSLQHSTIVMSNVISDFKKLILKNFYLLGYF